METDALLEKPTQHHHRSDHSHSPQHPRDESAVDVIAKQDVKKDITGHLALAVASCVLGSSFQYGFNGGVVNAPEEVLKEFYNETYFKRYQTEMPSSMKTVLWAVTVSIYCLGGMLGGVFAGYWANKLGRKETLLKTNMIMILAVAVEIFSYYVRSYEILIGARFFVGMAAGINTGVAPMYLSEIAPVSLRGLCGTFHQFAIVLGVMISEVIGLKVVLGNKTHWQFALGFALIPVLFQVVTLPWCPESPRYLLITRHRDLKARQALIWLRRTAAVEEELAEMLSERETQRRHKKFSVKHLFKSSRLRRPLIISLMMQLSQQLSGINAVTNYSTSIFEDAGLSNLNAQYATLGTGAVNVLMTFVSALVVDRVGRRTLQLWGLGGLFIASYVLTLGLIFQSSISWFSYVCIGAVVCYMIAFATGPGSIPWFITAELFAQGPRSAAVSACVFINWSANFAVTLVFPILQGAVGAYSFVPFVVFPAVFWLYTLFRVPETKGRTIEEITAAFRDDLPRKYRHAATSKDP